MLIFPIFFLNEIFSYYLNIYIPFFLGYYIYFIKIFVDLQKKKINCTSLKNIKTEDYIKDFIKTFCNNNDYKNTFLLVLIIIFSFSFILVATSNIMFLLDKKGYCNCDFTIKVTNTTKHETPEKKTTEEQVGKPILTYDTSKTTN